MDKIYYCLACGKIYEGEIPPRGDEYCDHEWEDNPEVIEEIENLLAEWKHVYTYVRKEFPQ